MPGGGDLKVRIRGLCFWLHTTPNRRSLCPLPAPATGLCQCRCIPLFQGGYAPGTTILGSFNLDRFPGAPLRAWRAPTPFEWRFETSTLQVGARHFVSLLSYWMRDADDVRVSRSAVGEYR